MGSEISIFCEKRDKPPKNRHLFVLSELFIPFAGFLTLLYNHVTLWMQNIVFLIHSRFFGDYQILHFKYTRFLWIIFGVIGTFLICIRLHWTVDVFPFR